MKRSIILYSIPQDAMFSDIELIAASLGLKAVPGRFGYGHSKFESEGRLYAFYHGAPSNMWQRNGVTHVKFIDAADQYNRQLPMTRWRSGEPPEVGEWNASCDKRATALRWWNGEWWSVAYDALDFPATKEFARKRRSCWQTSDVYWRGTSVQPITAGFSK